MSQLFHELLRGFRFLLTGQGLSSQGKWFFGTLLVLNIGAAIALLWACFHAVAGLIRGRNDAERDD